MRRGAAVRALPLAFRPLRAGGGGVSRSPRVRLFRPAALGPPAAPEGCALRSAPSRRALPAAGRAAASAARPAAGPAVLPRGER